jgi:hypothetical protein
VCAANAVNRAGVWGWAHPFNPVLRKAGQLTTVRLFAVWQMAQTKPLSGA